MKNSTTNGLIMTEKRILTLLVEIDEKDISTWIWDSHISGTSSHGINVIAICEGDQLKDIEEAENYLARIYNQIQD